MTPRETLVQAAQAMDALNVGAIPVCDGDKLMGMVTDRDIVLRGVAQNCPMQSTPLSAVMSTDTCWCFEDQTLDEVAAQMRDRQIRRMPVVDHDQHLVGILSLGDVATKGDGKDAAGDALQGISSPAHPDRSGQSAASGSAGGGGEP
jgi:CBS domain-containing protein